MDNNKPVAERCAMTVAVGGSSMNRDWDKHVDHHRPTGDYRNSCEFCAKLHAGETTPGPWRRSFDAVYAGTGDAVKLIAKVPHVGDMEQETIANIDLLAAAPELLEACQSILNDGADWLSDDASTMLKRAIRKATKP